MARTLSQIEASLASSIEEQDSSIDTQKGPVFDFFIRPQAAQFRATELLYDDLSRRYSLDYVVNKNPTVLQLYGANHGVRRSPGRAARGNVVFFTSAAIGSTETLVIPAGTVVSTADPTVAYRTTRDAYILGASLSSFYNASARRYEVRVPVEALGSGTIFEVPPNRVTRILSSIRGIDGVINRERIANSLEAEAPATFGRRIRSKFNGLALGSGDGLNQLIRNFDPSSITDVAMVYSSDYTYFRRRVSRSAWDVYLIGSATDTASVTYVGDGVRRDFPIPNVPATAVSSVTVDTFSVGFSFVQDSTDQFRRSTRAADKVVLDSIPGLNSTIKITYSYNKLITDTQTYANKIGIQLYRSDILVREAIPVPIKATVLVQVLSSFDETEAAAAAFDSVSNFINTEKFVTTLSANDLRSQLSSDVAGIANIDVLEFTRNLTGTIPVETIEFAPFEYPVSQDALITIKVRR